MKGKIIMKAKDEDSYAFSVATIDVLFRTMKDTREEEKLVSLINHLCGLRDESQGFTMMTAHLHLIMD